MNHFYSFTLIIQYYLGIYLTQILIYTYKISRAVEVLVPYLGTL